MKEDRLPSGFLLTRKAESDLRAIALYTLKTWGPKQRDTYLKKIDDAFHDIADMPRIGTPSDHIRIGYRKYTVGKHLIFYRAIDEEKIEIVRILHASMDVENWLPDSS